MYHPSLQLLGISTCYGNAPLQRTTYNALSILEAIGRPDVEVVTGARKPFCRGAEPATEIHGETGIDGTTLLPTPSRSAAKENGILRIYQCLMACPPQTAWLVVTGPLTNAALLIATFPDVVGHIKGLSIMGGSIGTGFTNANLGKPFGTSHGDMQPRIGNYTPYAEFNIWVDPESAQSVFRNTVLSAKTMLITLDLSHQVFATSKIQDMVLYGQKNLENRRPTRLRKMFFDLLTFFGKTYADKFGLTDGPPVHDPLTIAVILASLHQTHSGIDVEDDGDRYEINVELHDVQVGRIKIKAATDGVAIPRKLDTDSFWREIDLCLDRADGKMGRIPAPE